MSQKRYEEIDIAKGLGIILVILGHCVYYGGFTCRWIFSFHMPLFFFLSGIFFKGYSFRQYFEKKFKSMFIPFVFFIIFGGCFTFLIPEWRSEIGLKQLLVDVYYGSPSIVKMISLWFLICLAWVEVIALFVVRIKKVINQILCICAIFLLGLIVEYYYCNFNMIRLPLKIDSALIAIFFFYIGYLINIDKIKNTYEGLKFWEVLIVQILLFTITILISNKNGMVNLANIQINNVILYLLGSVLGILLVISVSFGVMRKMNYIKRCIVYIGKNSLDFMGFQSVYYYLGVYLINKIMHKSYEVMALPVSLVIPLFIFVFLITFASTYIKNKIISFIKYRG